MDKLDQILSEITAIKVDVGKIQTKIETIPELHTKMDDLCNRMTKSETRDKTVDELSTEKKADHKYLITLGVSILSITIVMLKMVIG